MIRQVKAARELEEATVRRAARRQQRVQQRVRQQQHQQHQHMMQAMPQPPYGNHNMQMNMNVQANGNMNRKPSVNTVHQSGRSMSPQMMAVRAPPMSPPPLMQQPPMHMAHPRGHGPQQIAINNNAPVLLRHPRAVGFLPSEVDFVLGRAQLGASAPVPMLGPQTGIWLSGALPLSFDRSSVRCAVKLMWRMGQKQMKISDLHQLFCTLMTCSGQTLRQWN